MQDDASAQNPPKRRTLMKLAGAAAVVGLAYGGAAALRRLSEPTLEFEPLTGLPGFRRTKGGAISGGVTALIGLEGSGAETEIGNRALCAALFTRPRDKTRVQIAYFSDYRCLYCRQVSPMLENLAQKGGVEITWHDLPLLGQISTLSAQAAVAARAQGAYGAFHHHLMGSPVLPTPAFLRQLAKEVGIDGDQLLKDMTAPKTAKHLANSSAVAKRFGFIGTPALVIGRTAVLGGIDRRMLERLISIEMNENRAGPCS